MYDKLKNNTNAEKWTLEEAVKFMNEAVELSSNKKYDFVGEVAKDLNQYHQVFTYLKNKFKEVSRQYHLIYSNCEANCFFNCKKGDIIPSLAIMNLKSNHKWTDRVDNTTGGDKTTDIKISSWVDGTSLGESDMDNFVDDN